jgi:hypothetical protein
MPASPRTRRIAVLDLIERRESDEEINLEAETCAQCGSDTALRAAARMLMLRDDAIKTLAHDLASAEGCIRAMWVTFGVVLTVIGLVTALIGV